jgi:hypothetical protein
LFWLFVLTGRRHLLSRWFVSINQSIRAAYSAGASQEYVPFEAGEPEAARPSYVEIRTEPIAQADLGG